jgi:Ca2+-binding EF-hand superfamily protein
MKSKKTNRIKYSVLMLIAGAGISYAQPPQGQEGQKPPTIEELFKQMDANKDNKLSKAEVKGPLKDDFAKIDLDKDGFITKEELKKAPKPEGKRPENKK